jgi:hypothetical protein
MTAIGEIKTIYPVYSLSMLHFLIRQGFNCIKVDDNENNPNYKRFLFHDSRELRKQLTAFHKRQGV